MFGEWFSQDISLETEPFEHILVPSFFNSEIAEMIYKEFPVTDDPRYPWKHYHNPIEYKSTLNDFTDLSGIRKVYESLQSFELIEKLRKVSGIKDLAPDPHLHGAGLHASPTGGKNDLHLDYMVHPLTMKERRLNLIVFLNKNWNHEWGGNLELWDAECKKCVKVIKPEFNTAILFKTGLASYHGLPRPMKCPENLWRKTLTNYYVSELRPSTPHVFKAEFFNHPEQPIDVRLDKLRSIRKTRIIKPEDLAEWPTWREDGNGWWV
jgi:Rps23 Pro-64 3,4-dihydroxylase Tpa1-like proline 4-hydroxylase